MFLNINDDMSSFEFHILTIIIICMNCLKRFLLRLYTFISHPSTLFYFKNFKGSILYPGVVLKGSSKIILKNTTVARGCSIKAFGKEKPSIVITDSYIADRAYISSKGHKSIVINKTSFAPNVFIGSYKHSLTKKETDGNYTITIDSPCFIGQNVSIFGNVFIGKGSVIGACSVVNKNIDQNCMYVGNPIKKIKTYSKEFDEWIKIDE